MKKKKITFIPSYGSFASIERQFYNPNFPFHFVDRHGHSPKRWSRLSCKMDWAMLQECWINSFLQRQAQSKNEIVKSKCWEGLYMIGKDCNGYSFPWSSLLLHFRCKQFSKILTSYLCSTFHSPVKPTMLTTNMSIPACSSPLRR